MQRNGDHSRPGRESPVALSDVLTAIAEDPSRERIAVAELMMLLEHRAIGALIFVFALPNVIPLPPGASTVLGAPLLFLTAQLALGLRPWLPKTITRRTIERVHFARLIQRFGPLLGKTERLLKPRLEFLTTKPVEYLVGSTCFLLSCVLFLPIPMGNIPPAVAICLFALALLERDGVWVLMAFGVTIAAVALVWGVIFALFESATVLFARAFG